MILRHTSGGEQVSFHGKPEVVIPVGEELYILDAVEAQADPDTAVVCAFGDSITEGVNSTLNGSDTWPDVFSWRLHSAYAVTRLRRALEKAARP